MFKKLKNLYTLTKRVEKLEEFVHEQETKECQHRLIYKVITKGYCCNCDKLFEFKE